MNLKRRFAPIEHSCYFKNYVNPRPTVRKESHHYPGGWAMAVMLLENDIRSHGITGGTDHKQAASYARLWAVPFFASERGGKMAAPKKGYRTNFVGFWVSPELDEKINTLAGRLGVSRSKLLRVLVKEADERTLGAGAAVQSS